MSSEIVTLINGLAWPVVVLAALFAFYRPIKSVIANRNVKIGPSGFEMSVVLPQRTGSDEAQSLDGLTGTATQVTIAASTAPEKISLYYAAPFRQFMDEIEARISQDLPTNADPKNKDRENILKRLYVDNSSALYLERASRYIFGSQLDALGFIMSSGGRAAKATLKPFYDFASGAYPAPYANYSFDQWIHFMVQWRLVKEEGPDLLIEPAGMAITPYMTQWGYLTPRPMG